MQTLRGGRPRRSTAAIDRLAAEPTAREFVVHEICVLRLRALLAEADGDKIDYREYRDRYRALATSLGFEGRCDGPRLCPNGSDPQNADARQFVAIRSGEICQRRVNAGPDGRVHLGGK